MIDACVKSGQRQEVHHVQNVQQTYSQIASRNVKAHSLRLGASFPSSALMKLNWLALCQCWAIEQQKNYAS